MSNPPPKGYVSFKQIRKITSQSYFAIKTICQNNNIDILVRYEMNFVLKENLSYFFSPEGQFFCGACGQHKDKSHLCKKGDRCKECHNLLNTQWRQENPERNRESNAISRNKCKEVEYEKRKDPTIKKKNDLYRKLYNYNMSKESYIELQSQYQNGCIICTTYLPSDKLHIDHCHTSGRVRGLICSKCNMGLGLFKDNISSLQNAILYLQKNNSTLRDIA